VPQFYVFRLTPGNIGFVYAMAWQGDRAFDPQRIYDKPSIKLRFNDNPT